MTSRVYTTAEVASITGFSMRRLDYWARQEIVVPSVQQAYGSGTRRLYSIDDLVQLQFIRQLKRYGCSLQKIRSAVTSLRMVMGDPDPLKSAVLVYSKTKLFALCKTRAGERVVLDALDAGGQQVMGIVLEALEEETKHLVAQLATEVTADE